MYLSSVCTRKKKHILTNHVEDSVAHDIVFERVGRGVKPAVVDSERIAVCLGVPCK